MNKLRVLIVEDSLTVRHYLCSVLSADPSLEVVGVAGDGVRAIELCEQLRPDVITMDLILPQMTGLTATEHIMAYCPTPILIVSASCNRGELMQTYDALAAGAVEVLEKPSSHTSNEAWEQRYRYLVKLVSRIPVITHPRARLRSSQTSQTGLSTGFSVKPPMRPKQSPQNQELRTHSQSPSRPEAKHLPGAKVTTARSIEHQLLPGIAPRLVALGASTGGPRALSEIFAHLPQDFPLPILVVLHIGSLFGQAFAEWLGTRTALSVRLAEESMPLPAVGESGVLVAPPGTHLVLRGNKLRLTLESERHACRPSVDVLFESVAQDIGPAAIACLLTGMGKDGAEGLASIREAGGVTFAQDEATSAIFGMPQAAIAMGAAQYILPLQEFAPALVKLAQKR